MSPAEARLKEVPSGMTDAEWNQRVNLAACYRLIAHYGWDDLVDTHISARVPGPDHHFLINPYGLMFDEITASSLVKVGLDGNRFRLLIGIGFLVIVFWSSDGVIGLWERWRRNAAKAETRARGGHGHG